MNNALTILWTSDNKTTFTEMVSMYARNARANGWWGNVRVVIWGASAQLAGSDPDVKRALEELQEHGVVIEACKACADDLCVTESLEASGVVVRYWGEKLTDALRNETVLSV